MRGGAFVATLCLMLTATTDGLSSKKKRKKTNDSVMERRRVCQEGPCAHLVPLEAKNCVNECVSPDCYRKIFAEPLEDGEINTQLSKNFMSCARKDLKFSTKFQRQSGRQAASALGKSAAAAAAADDSAQRESLEVLVDGRVVEKENEAKFESDSDDGMGDSEDGEWDAGFEESSDVGEEDSSEEQDGDQLVAALR
ncbi:unnamed protein product [Pylaiella littoralis]